MHRATTTWAVTSDAQATTTVGAKVRALVTFVQSRHRAVSVSNPQPAHTLTDIALACKFYLLYINFMSTRENNIVGFVRDLPRLPGARQKRRRTGKQGGRRLAGQEIGRAHV